ncbi:hypothetical protein FFK22_008725 [Mycobacterium sp. KBS0706]|uniref:hypothetical protein n=1 Tax=Mycobacterium sp. KBS0706 TaxID=2578109 RepID=UPI00110F7694|nr:hypothetical protein [Mycobacterium sp. KBS0706]TSD89056.1 hypothetical protein FFK22_008725 [Mycobacterium sp. KBS0706]
MVVAGAPGVTRAAGPGDRDDPRRAARDYIDGLTSLGFELVAGPPGRWWEREPMSITPAQRLQESALRSVLAAAPGQRRAVRDELVRRGMVVQA